MSFPIRLAETITMSCALRVEADWECSTDGAVFSFLTPAGIPGDRVEHGLKFYDVPFQERMCQGERYYQLDLTVSGAAHPNTGIISVAPPQKKGAPGAGSRSRGVPVGCSGGGKGSQGDGYKGGQGQGDGGKGKGS